MIDSIGAAMATIAEDGMVQVQDRNWGDMQAKGDTSIKLNAVRLREV